MTRGWDRVKEIIKKKRYSGLANGRLQCSYSGSLPCCPASVLQGLFQTLPLVGGAELQRGEVAARMTF